MQVNALKKTLHLAGQITQLGFVLPELPPRPLGATYIHLRILAHMVRPSDVIDYTSLTIITYRVGYLRFHPPPHIPSVRLAVTGCHSEWHRHYLHQGLHVHPHVSLGYIHAHVY